MIVIEVIDYVSVDPGFPDLVSGVSGVLYVALKKPLLQPVRLKGCLSFVKLSAATLFLLSSGEVSSTKCTSE